MVHSTSKQKPALPKSITAIGPVEQCAIGDLKAYPGNARTHSDKQVAQIARSLESFGWMNVILAERDGTIIAGHGRWMAAKQLGLRHVPVIRVDHLSDDATRAYRLADNRLAELSGWDDEILRIELQHLNSIDLDFSIETIGWDHADIDVMVDPPANDTSANDPADDDVPEPPAQPVSRLGDLWLLGEHRLFNGSCLDAGNFETLMAGKKASMVFQDAPYNVPVQGHVSGLGKVTHREFEFASGEMTKGEFRVFLADNLRHVTNHIVEGAILDLFMDWRGLLPLQLAMEDAGLSLINLAVWAKTNGGMGSLYRSQHELVAIGKFGRASHINNVELGKHKRWRSNLWRYAGVNAFGRGRMEQLEAHPTCKPVALVADAIRDVSHRGQIVLDSFMGSGTTLLAAERTGRIAYGMDIDPGYIDVTIQRWQDMTGKDAVLLSTGETFSDTCKLRYSV